MFWLLSSSVIVLKGCIMVIKYNKLTASRHYTPSQKNQALNKQQIMVSESPKTQHQKLSVKKWKLTIDTINDVQIPRE